MRPIQLYLLAWWSPARQPLTFLIPVNQVLKVHFTWWLNRTNFFKGTPLQEPNWEVTLVTDASEKGWGAHLGNVQTAGLWPISFRNKHINWLELKAVFLALQEFVNLLANKNVLVRSDNATVVSYLNKQGGTKSPELCYLTWHLYQWCIIHCIQLKAAHIPGKRNVIADALSRGKPFLKLTEWTLNSMVANLVFNKMGQPSIDLFATSQNKKLPVFVSPFPDETAVAVDALSLNWTGMFAYAYPPPIILPKVLQKVLNENCTIILIAPVWPRQSWYPQILELMIDFPIRLPLIPDLLSQRGIFHPDPEIFSLVAWKVSNCRTKQKDFLKKVQQLWQMPESSQLSQFTMVDSEFLIVGVKNGISIPVRQLFLK